MESDGRICTLSEYKIEQYGEAVFSDNPKSKNGEFRRSRSMIPFEYIGKTTKDFDWKVYGDKAQEQHIKISAAFIVNFPKFDREGKGLYIYSGTRGSGKTLLSCCLTNEVMNRHDINVKFISILDYLELTKKGYSSMADKEEKNGIMGAKVLVLDDIGVEVSKEWVNTTLYHLINFRYSNKLITIFTSNYSIEELNIDGRIKDRINAMCLPLHIPEISVRAMESNNANKEFIKSLI